MLLTVPEKDTTARRLVSLVRMRGQQSRDVDVRTVVIGQDLTRHFLIAAEDGTHFVTGSKLLQ